MPYSSHSWKTHLWKFRVPNARVCGRYISLRLAINFNSGRCKPVLSDRAPQELSGHFHDRPNTAYDLGHLGSLFA